MNYKIHAGKGMETRNQLKDWEKVEGTGGWRRGCGQRGGCLGCVMEVERSRPWAGPGGLSMWEWQISLPPFLRLLLTPTWDHTAPHSFYWGLRWPLCLQIQKVFSSPYFAWFFSIMWHCKPFSVLEIVSFTCFQENTVSLFPNFSGSCLLVSFRVPSIHVIFLIACNPQPFVNNFFSRQLRWCFMASMTTHHLEH